MGRSRPEHVKEAFDLQVRGCKSTVVGSSTIYYCYNPVSIWKPWVRAAGPPKKDLRAEDMPSKALEGLAALIPLDTF